MDLFMNTVQQKEYTVNDYKVGYNNITSLCDCAEELLATVENSVVADPQTHLELVEPLINEIADASDILAEEFLLIAESRKPRGANKFSKKRIESALRRIFVTLNEYQKNMELLTRKASSIAATVTTPIIKKIQDKLDMVVAIFFEFIQISLQSIMSKTELDALKIRNTHIALMLHQSSLSQYS